VRIFRRYPYLLVALDPARPMAAVTIKSRDPLDQELADLRASGHVIVEYCAPGKTIKNLRPAIFAGEATTPAVAIDAPTATSEPVAPESEPPAPSLSRREQLATMLADTPGQSRYSAVQLAKDLAPQVGCSEATARRYIGEYRRAQAA
jgi:hypothetical protein